jgi:hypothetical protein
MARGVASLVAFSIFIVAQAYGQYAISAQAGLVHHTEGLVFMNEKALPAQFGRFPQLREADVLRTERGRAEILLAPGVFLRLGRDTLIRLLSSKITDAKVELVSGEVVLETVQLKGIEAATLISGETSVSTKRRGVYHLEAKPGGLRVFNGEALVVSGRQQIDVKKGREILFEASLAPREFDPRGTDALDRWSDRRSQLLAWANGALLLRKAQPPAFAYQAADSGPVIIGLGSGRRTRQSVQTYGGGIAP